MKKVIVTTLLLITSLTLTACSIMHDNEQSTKRPNQPPVAVENAQVSTPTSQSTPSATSIDHDQNTLPTTPLSAPPANNEAMGGALEKSMEKDDKIKMSRALDKSPGKTTSWTNNRTQIHYEVTPVKKIVLKDNPYCRTYTMLSIRGAYSKEISGTACVSDDGNWHPL